MRVAWVVHNPAAGRFPSESSVRRAVAVFAGAGWSVRSETATRREHLQELVIGAARSGADVLVVAGGDGTVGLAASLLRGSQTALAVLPTGTANVWARELGTPPPHWSQRGAFDLIAERLIAGEVRPVDLGEANGRAFLLWAGTGLDARVVNLVEPRRRMDKVLPTTLYAIHALRSAQGWEGMDLEVSWPGGKVRGRYLVAVASNVRSYGGGLLRLAPEARVDDGLLDFWILEGKTIGDTVVRLLQVARGVHLKGSGFVHFRSAEAEFRSGGSLPMHFDGEPGTVQSPVSVRVLPKDLLVLLPSGGATGLFQSTGSASSEA
ncbi:MAG TPA: diacylglycerol kinase family protein [Anaerolineales bacterium]|nr:diacylglycerol kinase family protein [Anaerolineales bacterium]